MQRIGMGRYLVRKKVAGCISWECMHMQLTTGTTILMDGRPVKGTVENLHNLMIIGMGTLMGLELVMGMAGFAMWLFLR